MTAKNPSILFICVANSARSQMAEGLARHYLPRNWEVHSAGSLPAKAVHPGAIEALREIEIDISWHHPKSLSNFSRENLAKFDFVATLCAEEQCPVVVTSARRLNWSLEDPAGPVGAPLNLAKFREVRSKIQNLLENFMKEQGVKR